MLSPVAIPLPGGIPITLQCFAVALCGCLLGVRRSVSAVAVYVLIGALGAPVFSGLAGGAGVLFGKTGGFLFGFPALAAMCGLCGNSEKSVLKIFYGMIGLVICHATGTVWYAVLSGTGVTAAFLVCSAPFIIKDALSITAACLIAKRVKKHSGIRSQGLRESKPPASHV